jgi:hypothetical protein
VLVASGLVVGAAFLALATLPAGAPLGVLAALAALAGAAQPPLGACLRTLWPDLLDGDRDAIRSAFALEATVLELTYIAGPAGFLLLAAVTSTGLSMAVLGGTLAVGTLAFAADPVSRAWRPDATFDTAGDPRGSALRAPGVATLAAVSVLVGVVMGGAEVGVTAAGNAHGGSGVTSALLAIWGVGSLLGGVVAARAGGARGARDLILLLAVLGVAHVALAAGATSALALGVLLLVAGAWIAPVFAATSTLTGELARPGTQTEAFSWNVTALAAGVALGSAVAGVAIDAAGTGVAFVAVGAAGLGAAALAAARAGTLAPGRMASSPGCASGLTATCSSPSAASAATP